MSPASQPKTCNERRPVEDCGDHSTATTRSSAKMSTTLEKSTVALDRRTARRLAVGVSPALALVHSQHSQGFARQLGLAKARARELLCRSLGAGAFSREERN